MSDEAPVVQKKGLSTLAKVAIGCGALVVLGLCLIAGGAYVAYIKVKEAAEKRTAAYEARGYTRAPFRQMHQISAPPAQKTVYMGQMLQLEKGADASVAAVCQMAEIHGEVKGDVEFWGQVLTIARDAVIHGNVIVEGAQMVSIHGQVKGTVSGSWQLIENPGGATVGAAAPAPEEPAPDAPAEIEVEEPAVEGPTEDAPAGEDG